MGLFDFQERDARRLEYFRVYRVTLVNVVINLSVPTVLSGKELP
jgi:hypothetical protein